MVVFAALGGIGTAFIDMSAMEEKEKRAAKAAVWASVGAAGAATGIDSSSAAVGGVMAAKELSGLVIEDAKVMQVVDASAGVATGLVSANYVEIAKVTSVAAVGAGIGAATDGVDGMTAGMTLGAQLSSGDTSTIAGKVAGAGLGAAVGAQAGDGEAGEDALAGAKLGASVGGTAAGLGTDTGTIQEQRGLMREPPTKVITDADVVQKQVGAGAKLAGYFGGSIAEAASTDRERTVATGTASAKSGAKLSSAAFGLGMNVYGDATSEPKTDSAPAPAKPESPDESLVRASESEDAEGEVAANQTDEPWNGEGEILEDLKRADVGLRYATSSAGLAAAIAGPALTQPGEAEVKKLKELGKKGLRSKNTVRQAEADLKQARDLQRILQETAGLRMA